MHLFSIILSNKHYQMHMAVKKQQELVLAETINADKVNVSIYAAFVHLCNDNN